MQDIASSILMQQVKACVKFKKTFSEPVPVQFDEGNKLLNKCYVLKVATKHSKFESETATVFCFIVFKVVIVILEFVVIVLLHYIDVSINL